MICSFVRFFFLIFLIKIPLVAFDSWDFFDTLVARKLLHPQAHYDLIEKNFPFPNFKQLRIKSEKNCLGDLDSIYIQFQKYTGISDLVREALKNYEIQTETNNLFPILENFNKIKDGDIVVSDTYYSESQISSFLKKLGCQKNIKLFVSVGGKHSGTVWEYLSNLYGRNFIHNGDNYHSDVIMAEKYGIKANYYTKSSLNPFEKELLRTSTNENLVLLIRSLRLSDPYPVGSVESSVFLEQAVKNIPLLVLFSHALKLIVDHKKCDKILFSTRDCCHLKKIFTALYPEISSQEFYASRHIYKDPSVSYVEYVRNICSPQSLIVDLQGSGKTVLNFFEKNFTFTPHIVYLVKSVENPYLMNQSKNINFVCAGHDIERYNYDLVGTLIGFQKDKPIRKEMEYDSHFVKVMHDCLNYFLENFISDFNIKFNEKDFLFYLKHSQRSHILRRIIFHEENH